MFSPVSASFPSMQWDSTVIQSMTDRKVKRVAMAFFACLAMIMGYYAWTFKTTLGTSLFLLSIVITYCCIWILHRAKKYDDPNALNIYRKEAKKSPLEKTLATHGMENVCRFSLIKDKDFAKKLKKSIEKQSFSESLEFYKAHKKSLKNYHSDLQEIFLNLLIEKLEKETLQMSLGECIEAYDIDELHRLHIITDETNENVKNYLQNKRAFDQEKKVLEEKYTKKGKEILTEFSEKLESQVTMSPSEKEQLSQYKREAEYLARVPFYSWFELGYEIIQPAKSSHQDNGNALLIATNLFAQRLQTLKLAREQEFYQLQANFERATN